MERLIVVVCRLVAFVLGGIADIVQFVIGITIEALGVLVTVIDGSLKVGVVLAVAWAILYLLSLG